MGNYILSSFALHHRVQDSSFLFKFCLRDRISTFMNRNCCLIVSSLLLRLSIACSLVKMFCLCVSSEIPREPILLSVKRPIIEDGNS